MTDHADGCPNPRGACQDVWHLPWIAPSAAGLLRLCQPLTATTWPVVRQDPGTVLLLLRHASRSSSLPFPGHLLHDPQPLEETLRLLTRPAVGVLDSRSPAVENLLTASRLLGRLAHALAVRSGRCDPDRARLAGLLAPLGWLALAAVNAGVVAHCLGDPTFIRDPFGSQTIHLGCDHPSLVRRLTRQWDLPPWLGGVLAHMDLTAEQAAPLEINVCLHAAVRLSIYLAREQGVELGLVGDVDPAVEKAILGLQNRDTSPTIEPRPEAYRSPYEQPLLLDLLTLAAENRRLQQRSALARVEAEIDRLHETLRLQTRGEGARLRQSKLMALAEFAAGAGHEINNPLAVISGQAQYLLGHASEWFTEAGTEPVRKSLEAVIGQTKRIHAILRDLMLFARPTPPKPAWVDLPSLLGEVAATHREQATAKQVGIEVRTHPERFSAHVDADQIRLALGCLVKNSLEAVADGGWIRLTMQPGVDRIEVLIEDSGPGPAIEQRELLFDPFFSGRNAGRGKGLGLPIAWRLARLQEGDVRLEPTRPGVPTCFVLSLPRREEQERHAA